MKREELVEAWKEAGKAREEAWEAWNEAYEALKQFDKESER